MANVEACDEILRHEEGRMVDLPENRTDILVVGAGPVGLTAAAELARHGQHCRIIDKAPAPSSQSKALAIFPRTLEVFENMGMIEPVLKFGNPLHRISLYARKRPLAHLNIDKVDSPYPFVISLPQNQTERILIDHLASLGVEVERMVELSSLAQDEKGITAILHHPDGREETCTVAWLVGCDGAHSTVRHSLGDPFLGKPYREVFVLADVKLSWSLPNDEASIFFHSDGVLAIFPMPGRMFRIVADISLSNDLETTVPTLMEIQKLVNVRGPDHTVLSDPSWISKFHLSRRKVQHFRKGGVFLAGDAAHIHSPAGGQGMNTGIQDAHNLAWKLALVATDQAPESLLDSYHTEREPVAKGVLQLTDFITQAATLRHPLTQLFRNLVVSVLTKIEPISHLMVNQLAEVAIHYRHSPIVAQHRDGAVFGLHSKGPTTGDRAPDGQLLKQSGESIRLFQLLQDTRHTLLLFGGIKPTANDYQNLAVVSKIIRENYEMLIAAHAIVISQKIPNEFTSHSSTLLDNDRTFHHRYGANTSSLFLVRPDGYISFCGLMAKYEMFLDYIRRFFTIHGRIET